MLDRWLYRSTFEGRTAHRYARIERCGFGDLDDRLIRAWGARLTTASHVLDVGSGPGSFGRRLTATHPHLAIACLEPSRSYASDVRAVAEHLPFRDDTFDIAVCLSSIRHVRDRDRALAELARVVRSDGAAYVVDLDPDASRYQIARHAAPITSWLRRAAFGQLVVKTAPQAIDVAQVACANGWSQARIERDVLQPVYVVELRHELRF
jgi:ubiquinone/menaquinone biosynthesis C-methylase UbiE